MGSTKENFTAIPNNILDALIAYRLPGEQRQVLDKVFRETFGWHKDKARISLSDISKATGIKRSNVSRAIKALVEKKLITVIKSDNGYVLTFRFNKNYKQWKLLSKKITVIKNDNKPLSKKITVQPPVLLYKERKKIYSRNSEEFRLSEYLFEKMKANNPKVKTPNLDKWAIHVDRMIRLDKRSPDEIAEVINFSQSDSFWMSNILSTQKLREQFDQLWLKLKNQKPEESQAANRNTGFNPATCTVTDAPV
jgi:phage replication O-like protein O